MTHIITFRSCEKSRLLFDRLALVMRERGIETSRMHATSGFGIHADCRGKKLALVSLTGTLEEVLAGFSVLHGAMRTCPVAILLDFAGYSRCVEIRRFDFQKVRFGVRLGSGAFDPAIMACLVARGEKTIIGIPQDDWEHADLARVVEKVRAIAMSESRICKRLESSKNVEPPRAFRGGNSFYHSISFSPCSFKYSFAFENGFEPKNFVAEKGDGCALSMTQCFARSRNVPFCRA